MRATRPRFGIALFLAAVVSATLIAPTLPVPAAPTNAKIEATRERAAEARDKLDRLSDDLEERNEEYLEVEDALAQTKRRIAKNERELADALTDLDAAEGKLNERANNIYRKGDVDVIAVILGATDFQDFVSRLDLLRRIGRSDATVVAAVKDARDRIETTKASLENRRAELVSLRRRAATKRAEVEAALSAQKSYLATLDRKLKKLIAEERARQEQIAREKARRAAEMARRSSFAAGRPFDPAALGGSHAGAVDIARSFVGKTPYVWGGTSPSGFDCSGLTQYCYRAVGVSIPRTSRQQFRFGAFIPPDRLDLLKAGDLVFFGRGGDPSRVHHVGIYAGNDQFIHAPQSGELVSVTSLSGRIATRGDYVGATRP